MIAGLLADEAPSEERLALAEFLPFRLAVAAQSVSELFAATCEERSGLSTAAWRLLCALAEAGRLEARDLGHRTALDESAVREASAVLLARGLASRTTIDGSLLITDAGLGAHREVAGLALAAEAALLAGLSPAEVHSLHRLLCRLQGAADKLTGRAA